MKPLEIRIELLRKGLTAQALADDLGLARKTVSNVINGWGYSQRVAERLADETGIPVSVLFPGRSDQRDAA